MHRLLFVIAAGLLAGRARRAGHPALGSFTDSASLPVSAAFFWAALGLALHHHLDWTTPAEAFDRVQQTAWATNSQNWRPLVNHHSRRGCRRAGFGLLPRYSLP